MTEFLDNLIANGKGERCPCCERYAQVYKRKLSKPVVRQLYKLLSLGGDKNFIHASKLISPGVTGSGDLGKAKYWGLVEQKPHHPDEKKSSGFWKLTEMGVFFLNEEAYIRKTLYIYNDKIIKQSSEELLVSDIREAGFDYQKLLKGEV